MNILLVSPRTPDTFWSFRHVMGFVSRKAAYPPLGLLTVAAMLPREWNQRLVDLNVRRLRDEDIAWADYVFVGGMLVHADSVREIVARVHALGKPIVAGGPLFTTGHARFPEIEHVVLGEAEDLIPLLVTDMVADDVKPLYQSPTRPDVSRTPIPRWDLVRLRDYVTMPVQFSRGCPFQCEFCDIIVMNGRIPRTKSPAQITAELDALRAAGWNGTVFLVDDNFIGNRGKTKALLYALIEWRASRRTSMTFLTEASLNLVDHPDLLALMVQAGFKKVFVGIESPEAGSLDECAKVQNSKRNLGDAVRTIQRAGMEVMGGFIVGFDNDEESIFERQRRFIADSGVATAMVGLLTALPGTRLFDRLSAEGRITTESSGNNLDVRLNFVPRLDAAKLVEGYRDLVRRLYAPKAYYQRIATFLRTYRPSGPKTQIAPREVGAFLKSLWIMGVVARGRREYWKFLARVLLFHRPAFAEAMGLVIIGYHFRKVAAAL